MALTAVKFSGLSVEQSRCLVTMHERQDMTLGGILLSAVNDFHLFLPKEEKWVSYVKMIKKKLQRLDGWKT